MLIKSPGGAAITVRLLQKSIVLMIWLPSEALLIGCCKPTLAKQDVVEVPMEIWRVFYTSYFNLRSANEHVLKDQGD